MQNFAFDLQRFKDIYNDESNAVISGTSKADYIYNEYGDDCTIDGGAGNDSIYNEYGDDCTIDGGAGNDSIYNYFGDNVTIDAGDGADTVYNYAGDDCTIDGGAGNDSILNDDGDEYTIDGGAGNDSIYNYAGNDCTIDGGAGNDSIYNDWGYYCTIDGGAGNDSIYNYNSYYCTIDGGAGNDLISLSSESYGDEWNSYQDVIIYKSGDGKDKIYGFDSDDTLSISGGSYSTTKSGKNIIVTVDDGKISLIGAASYISDSNIVFTKTAPANAWKLDGTTATFGTSSKTLVTVKGVKSLDGLNVSGKVVTVKKDSLGTSKVTISDGYTLKLGDDVNAPSTSNKWTISGSTAKYNQTTSAGYTLASNSKSISYSKSASKILATVKGVKSLDGLSISGKVVTVKKASLGTSKVSISGTSYTLKLGSDVSASSTKKAAFSLNGSTATYKSSYKTAGYSLSSDGKSISYTKATTAESLATIKGAASKSGLSVSGNKITLKKSALKNKVTVSGAYEFDFASDYKKATISGSSSGDTITARGSNLSINGGAGDDTIKILGSNTTVTGGKGADTFVYKSGKNVISDYAAEDTISIASGTANVTTSGSDVIFTVGNGKITVKGGTNKTVTYTDAKGSHNYKKSSDDAKIITLGEDYDKETYTMGDKLRTLDASAVPLDIKINGNKLMNSIIGGAGNDTLKGGGSNDTLTGGEGADIFLYKKGDGNDLITDYAEEDSISITSDKVSTIKTSGSDVIFTLASKGKITVADGKDKVITYVDSDGEHMYPKIFKVKDKTITLTENYIKDTFDVTDYGNYKTINAAAVQRGLNIVGNELANSIFGTTDEDYIDGGTNNDTIRGGDGNDSLFGNAGKDKLYGGEGNDTLWGGKGNDWLDGGEGADIFIYNSGEGNDTIDGYDHDLDKIMVLSGTVENAAAVGSDVVFTMGTGEELTLLNAAGRNVKVFDGSNNKIKEYTARI